MIKVTHLTKRYDSLTAVDNLSFSVAEGEAVALWGANGAGKSTVLRCMLNLTSFQGHIWMNNLEVAQHGKMVRQCVGFVPQELNFHDDLSVRETITFYGRLRKIADGHDFTPLLHQLELLPHIEKPIKNLSGGLKQRLALALALISDPAILLLDEPTTNLDIRARDDFLNLLITLKNSGKTLLFSSHRLDEVTALANRVLMLEGGKLVLDSPPQELEERLGWRSNLYLYMSHQEAQLAQTKLTQLGLMPQINGRGVRVPVTSGRKGQIFHILHEAGIRIDDFTME